MLMPEFDIGIQSIMDGRGMPIAAAGMTIVFVALSSIATIISVLPWLLRQLGKVVPETDRHASRSRPAGDNDVAAVAAAAAAYHIHRKGSSP
jgi:Na+-transporting methylmalonyl-CoA/oxaloacetate decarboxylase gamma subunit